MAATHRLMRRFKLVYKLRQYRNGDCIKEVKKHKDLVPWRGQSVLAYLLSQGAVGTSTSAWKAAISSNATSPNMSDDSGDPLSNEFSPSLGTPVAVTWSFIPTTKPNSTYQTIATLTMVGTITVSTSGTLRKIGIIDSNSSPNCHVVLEDAVVDLAVLVSDTIEVSYFLQIG